MITASVADLIIAEAEKFIGVREVSPNRGPEIDKFNQNLGLPLGSAYCLAGIWYVLDMVAKDLGIAFNLARTGSTQKFWKESPREFALSAPERGAIAIFRSTKDETRGHAALCVGGLFNANLFMTIEFNTNSFGSRDGDGVMRKTRRLGLNGSLQLLGFVDTQSAIVIKGESKDVHAHL